VAVRRVGLVLVAALALTGCGVRTETVPGPAAPLTATPTPTSSPTTSPTTSPTGSPTTQVPSTSPGGFRNVSMNGSGLSITFPVPADWTVTQSHGADLSRTDAALGDDVLLRVDLTARGTGTARSGAERNEASIKPTQPGYTRLDLADVDGAGDDAVDWSFTFDQNGTPARVIDRQILSGPGAIAVFLRAPAGSYRRYLPVWQRAAAALVIRTS
jgi:hypothetical protein